MKKTALIILFLGCSAGVSAVQVITPEEGEMNAVETEILKVSNGSQLILPKGMKTTQIGGQIVVEDMQAFLLRRIEQLEKQLSEHDAVNAKLTLEVDELKNKDWDQNQFNALQTMLADLTARQQSLENEFAQLKESQTAASEYLPPVAFENFPPFDDTPEPPPSADIPVPPVPPPQPAANSP